MRLPIPPSTRSPLLQRAEADRSLCLGGRAKSAPPRVKTCRKDSEPIGRAVYCAAVGVKGRKKVQVALKHDGRWPLPEAARAHVRERSGCQSFVADLTSIVSAAHKLPAAVDPPPPVCPSCQPH